MTHVARTAAITLALIPLLGHAARAQLMVVGTDTKFWFDDGGNRVFKPSSCDAVLFYDLADPAHPALVGSRVYAGNFASNSISVLHLEDGKLIDTHAAIKLPGLPAVLRVGSQSRRLWRRML